MSAFSSHRRNRGKDGLRSVHARNCFAASAARKYAFGSPSRPPCKGGLQGGLRSVANTAVWQGRPSPSPSLPGRGVRVPTLDTYGSLLPVRGVHDEETLADPDVPRYASGQASGPVAPAMWCHPPSHTHSKTDVTEPRYEGSFQVRFECAETRRGTLMSEIWTEQSL